MSDINFLAVGVAAIAVFFVSFAWYSVFGAAMAELVPSASEATSGARPPLWQIALELVRSLIVGTVVAGLAAGVGVDTWTGGILLGLALWVGFPAVLLAGSVLWDKVPVRLAAIHGGDWLVKLLVITTIVSVWG
jgi:hypothetical protein